jgi:hypothetical protein
MTTTGKPRRAIAILSSMVFIGGIAVGIIADRALTSRASTGVRITNDMTHVLDRLQLSAAQRVQAESILVRRGAPSESLMIEFAERFQALADSVDAELRTILDSTQRMRLDSFKTRPTMLLKKKRSSPMGNRVDTVYRTPPVPGKKP